MHDVGRVTEYVHRARVDPRKTFIHLHQFQVAEFTLAENPGSNTSTSLLRSLCHKDDSVILGTRFQDAEEKAVEEQLLNNSASGSGALEHDVSYLFKVYTGDWPLPLGVAVVDKAILVFGLVFPRVAQKHRLQLLEHFSEHIKQASAQKGAEAVPENIFTAVLSSLKGLVEAKSKLGNQEDVKQAAVKLILGEFFCNIKNSLL